MADDLSDRQRGLGGALDEVVERVGDDERLDPVVAAVTRGAAALGGSALGPLLQGRWLGHSVHPLMTDIPIGCWTCSFMLDLAGGRAARPASRRLIAWGVLSALPTAATGLAELATIGERDPSPEPDGGEPGAGGPLDDDRRRHAASRRIAVVHAGLNASAVVAYAASWNHRRRDRHVRGLAAGLVGATLATAAGHLGGHLAYVRGVGHGARHETAGGRHPAPSGDRPDDGPDHTASGN
jgi:uncharacterized membrane protein